MRKAFLWYLLSYISIMEWPGGGPRGLLNGCGDGVGDALGGQKSCRRIHNKAVCGEWCPSSCLWLTSHPPYLGVGGPNLGQNGFGAEEGKEFESVLSLSGEKNGTVGFFFGADEGEITWGEKQPGSIAHHSYEGNLRNRADSILRGYYGLDLLGGWPNRRHMHRVPTGAERRYVKAHAGKAEGSHSNQAHT